MATIKQKLKKIFPNLYFSWLVNRYNKRFLKISDYKDYTITLYKQEFGVLLNLDNPKTFYEKINYLKLFFDEQDSELLVDKVLVKDYLTKLKLDQHIVKKIDSFSSFNSFKRFFSNQRHQIHSFVVKLNHTSGDVFFYLNGKWKDKHGYYVSKRFVFSCLSHKLKLNYFRVNLEKVYLNIKPKILVEEYVPSLHSEGLDEYKFFCNYGEIKMINIVYGRQKGERVKEVFTKPDLTIIHAKQNQQIIDEKDVYRPSCFEDMVDFCKKTSGNHPIIRVDLLTNGSIFYFCEFTFYDCAGLNIFYPLQQNENIGDMFDISEVLNERV